MQGVQGRRAIGVAIGLFVLFGLINGFWRSADAKALFWLTDILGYVILPIGSIMTLSRRFDIQPRDYGFISQQKSGASALNFISLGWVTLVLVLAIEPIDKYLWMYGNFARAKVSWAHFIPHGPMRLYVILYLAITAGLVEEMVYRGMFWRVLSGLSSRYRTGIYIAASSSLFGAVHWENGWPNLIAGTVFGFAASLIYLRIQTLWPLVVAHFVADIRAFAGWQI